MLNPRRTTPNTGGAGSMEHATVLPAPELKRHLAALRGKAEIPPDMSVIIPVNALGDLENALCLLSDLCRYQGRHTLEIILVVNNYPPDSPPSEIGELRELGVDVVSLPDVRVPGTAVPLSARIPGVERAACELNILFDADVCIPNPTALIDWYWRQFDAGCHLAYTHVNYYGLRPGLSIQVKALIHHSARWVKRNLFRIPTTRGSNYAVRRQTFLALYHAGNLADDMNVGPNIKAIGKPFAYSGRRDLTVLTSGRMFTPGWIKLVRYFSYRLFYNWRVIRVRPDVARYTGRERDPVRRFVNNLPV